MMLAEESRALCRRGTIIGTAITRAIKQPKNAMTNSSPGGNTSSARSPGCATVARRLATVFAAACKSRNVSEESSAPRSVRKTQNRSSPCVAARCSRTATSEENCSIRNPSACGRRLRGFCRGLFREVRGQVGDRRVIVERLGRELELEFVLQLHQQINRHGGVESKAGELRVDVHLVLRNPQDLGQLIDAERRDLVFSHEGALFGSSENRRDNRGRRSNVKSFGSRGGGRFFRSR